MTSTPTQAWDPLQMGHFLQAFFYETVSLSSPALSDSLHHFNGLKPFSVSLPLRWKLPTVHAALAHPAPTFYLRFTALTDKVYQALVAGLTRRCHTSPQLSLGPHTIDIQQVLFAKEDTSLSALTSYKELYDSPPARTVYMRFLTPTSFRSGRGNLPLPLPASLYRSLWQKWQRFAPPSLQIDGRIVTTVEQYLLLARYRLRTEIVSLKGVQQVGCTGTCQFELPAGIPVEDRRAITALSRFASYAGIGMKTTMGMGQTLVMIEEATT
ncbi:MAG: CRISPR-associated endoribonuclease Cas6 [Deltaproteobacteria bacterium]|nr:CRISPR-associated endoribonuclease Cas6 [Deltaproteobacteria bacterium]